MEGVQLQVIEVEVAQPSPAVDGLLGLLASNPSVQGVGSAALAVAAYVGAGYLRRKFAKK